MKKFLSVAIVLTSLFLYAEEKSSTRKPASDSGWYLCKTGQRGDPIVSVFEVRYKATQRKVFLNYILGANVLTGSFVVKIPGDSIYSAKDLNLKGPEKQSLNHTSFSMDFSNKTAKLSGLYKPEGVGMGSDFNLNMNCEMLN